MRVAFTTLAPFISGAERSLQVTLRRLPAAGVEPIVIGPEEAKIREWCRSEGVPFFTCPLALRDKWQPFRWWRSVRRLRGLLRQERIDVVHANQMYCYQALGAAARARGIPRVCHLRDEASEPAFRWFCASGVEAVVCISRHIERQATDQWPRQLTRPIVRTLINPVELPRKGECATQAARNALRQAWGFASDKVVMGFVGQIAAVKGLLPLLQILSQMLKNPTWRLVVAGRDPAPNAPYERACREFVSEHWLSDRVRFVGFLENVVPFYEAIDLAVVPSLQEPLGRIPLEAGACGRPTLAAAVGGLPDTIMHGDTGWLVPSGDSWRPMLETAWNAPLAVMGERARRFVESVAEPTLYAKQLAALYFQIVNRRRGEVEPGASASSLPALA